MTSAFVAAAEAHRKLLQQPQLPYLAVRHPMVSMSDDELSASADAIFAGVADAIARTRV